MDDQLGRERRQAPDASNDDEHAPAPFPIGQVFSLGTASKESKCLWL